MVLSIFPPVFIFFWKICSASWSYGKNDQHELAKAVRRSMSIHSDLSEINFNKLTDKNHGIILASNMCGRANELCDKIEHEMLYIDATNCTELIVSTINKCDPLSVATEVYEELQKLLCTRR